MMLIGVMVMVMMMMMVVMMMVMMMMMVMVIVILLSDVYTVYTYILHHITSSLLMMILSPLRSFKTV